MSLTRRFIAVFLGAVGMFVAVAYFCGFMRRAPHRTAESNVSISVVVPGKYLEMSFKTTNELGAVLHRDGVNSHDIAWLLLHGQAYLEFRSGNYESALANLNRALELNPRNPPALVMRAVIKGENNMEYDAAIADCNAAIKADADYGPAYSARGAWKLKKQDCDGAVVDLNRAIKLDPRDHIAFATRGRYKLGKGDYAGAMADLNRAIELNPEYAAAYESRGELKCKTGDYVGAMADLDHAIAIAPSSLSYALRGVVKEKRSDYDGAIRDYDEAVRLAPKYADAYSRRGLIRLEKKRDWGGAIADFDKAIDLGFSQQGIVLAGRAAAKYYTSDIEGAIDDATRATAVDPAEGLAYVVRSWARFKKADKQGALEDAQKGADIDQNRGGTIFGLIDNGFINFIRGDYEKAVSFWEQAIRQDEGWKPDLDPWIREANENRRSG
jgi:tetratricopeptide (TPR) repeat protein